VSRVDHADGQTDMTKLIVTFSNFANKPKSGIATGGILSSALRNERQNGADTVLWVIAFKSKCDNAIVTVRMKVQGRAA
jgi:hypothetical protein